MRRPHEDKITFSLVYRTQFFYTTCTKLDLAHAFLFERAPSVHLLFSDIIDFTYLICQYSLLVVNIHLFVVNIHIFAANNF